MSTNVLVTDPLESAEFKQHVRNLLYDYCTKHITTNYVTFTEDLVAEFLERLEPIPTTDPYSLTLLPDPFTILSQTYSLSNLVPYDETAETTQEACAYIKRWGAVPKGRPRTERLGEEWSDDTYQPPPELFIPALTRKARRATPKLGKKTQPVCRGTFQDLVKSRKFASIDVEPIEEPKLVPEEILKTAFEINAEELPAVKALLQSTTEALRPQKASKNRYLDPSFLAREFPGDRGYTPFEEEFVPLFPRARVPASQSGRTSKLEAAQLPGPKGFAEIPSVASLKQIEVEDPDPDISRQNLVVVDGWETIKSSPPSTPSSARSESDQEDQLNELFLRSSPPTTDPPLVEDIENAKMEEVMIPRSRRIGGNSGITPHILAGKTLETFLGPLLSKAKMGEAGSIPAPSIRSATDPGDQSGQPLLSSPTPSSLVGQPPSVLNAEGPDADTHNEEPRDAEKDLGAELQGLYQGHVEAWQDMIMNEKIEEKESMLWDVPDLDPPNKRKDADWLHVPKTFLDFLVPPSQGAAQPSGLTLKPLHQFLKKAKGRQSLGLALSWVPFTVDKKLPSVHELVGVDKLFDDDVVIGGSPPSELDKLFKALKIDVGAAASPDPVNEGPTSLSSFVRVGSEEEVHHPPEAYSFLSKDFQIMLNRQERRRLARVEGRAVEADEDEDDIAEEEDHDVADVAGAVGAFDQLCPETLAAPGEPARRLLDDRIELDDERPSKRQRLAAEEVADTTPHGELEVSIHHRPQPQTFDPVNTAVRDEGDHNSIHAPLAMEDAWHGPGENLHSGYENEWNTGEHDAEDKENIPPPSSSDPSSLFMDDETNANVADIVEHAYMYDYPAEDSVGHPQQHGDDAHFYDNDDDFAMDGRAHYHSHLAAAGHMNPDDALEDESIDLRVGGDGYRREEGEGSFEVLSFGSQYPRMHGRAKSSVLRANPVDEAHQEACEGPRTSKVAERLPNPEEVCGTAPDQAKIVRPAAYEPNMASQSLGIFAFAQLRARKVSASVPVAASLPAPLAEVQEPTSMAEEQPRGLPPELIDKDTIASSTVSFTPPHCVHRYMASIDLIQKHALVCALRAKECAVDFVERRSLGGVDLILDPYTAVIFLSLFTLPARCEAYVDKVSQLSQIFRYLLIVFEAYPEQLSKRAKPGKLEGSFGTASSSSNLYAYTPPIVKAIKKFRRDINIAGACGSKRAETVVQYAFADDVREAALFTRWFGDRAEEQDMTGGLIWSERRWLAEDYSEDEEECLAGVQGLNHFSASIILSQIPLQHFVHLLPEERAEVCGGLLADEIIAEFNADIENRLHALPSSSDIEL